MASTSRAISKMGSPRDQNACLSYHPRLTILAQSTRTRGTVEENLSTKAMSMKASGSATCLMVLVTKFSLTEINFTVSSC